MLRVLEHLFTGAQLTKYACIMADAEIDYESLLLLEATDMRDIGIPKGPQKKLELYITELRASGRSSPEHT